MIVSQPSKFIFYCLHPHWGKSKGTWGTFLEIRNIFGKLIYRIEKKGNSTHMGNYEFVGSYGAIKIKRNDNPIIDSFRVELIGCGEDPRENCNYLLTGKLPLLFKIKTDFYVEKDTSNS